MKREACVTGSNTMMNCGGNCSDSSTFSCAGNSRASSITSWVSVANASLSKSTPELQKTCLKYSQIGSEFGSCAAMRRSLGLTVKATSTCSSTEGS